MTRPILLVLDENAAHLGHIERELEDRYGRHYEVVGVGSSAEAHARLEHFATSGGEVALVLAGQWRAGEPAGQLLAAVHDLHPFAKRAVLIAWTDWGDPRTGREIFDGIADGRFDHYVMRPLLSPDEQFHQTISMVLHLAQYARSITLVVRARSLRDGMSDYLIRQVEATENIQTRLGCEVVGGGGIGRLDHLILRDMASRSESRVDAQALFVLIGAEPHTGWLPAEIEQDERGFILTGADVSQRSAPRHHRSPLLLETSMPGVFAAGDVRHGSVKRVASAVGEGSIAVQLLHRYFSGHR